MLDLGIANTCWTCPSQYLDSRGRKSRRTPQSLKGSKSQATTLPLEAGMASVLLGDLDDFIAPGQACINPLFTNAADAAPAAAAAESAGSKGGAAMVLELEDDGGPLDAMVCVGVV